MEDREAVKKTDQRLSCSPQYLGVEDTMRLRASSDPGGLHICIVPEITITGEDGRSSDCNEDDEFDSFLALPPPRPRANTCPEEMFRSRKGRPPTPPPDNVSISRHPAGKRFSFNVSPRDINGLSFALHKLSKVHEDMKEESQPKSTKTHSGQVSAVAKTSFSGGAPSYTSNTDKDFFSRLKQCDSEDLPLIEVSNDKCESKRTMNMSLEEPSGLTNNYDKNTVAGRDTEQDVISCSSSTCRSKDDEIENLESDHLVTC